MTGYTRQDTSNNIANGNVIDADDLDGEFNALESAFNSSTGHNHDGTSGEGAPILVVGPAQDIVTSSTQMAPKADDTYDLGSATNKWKDLYVDGVAYVDAINLNGTAITSTATELNLLDGATLTTTELNYVDGVTSSIQTQLDNKQPLDAGLTSISGLTTSADKMIYTTASDTYAVTDLTSAGRALLDDANAAAQLITLGLTATAAELNILDGATLTTTELNYVDGVTSAIQTQLDNKQPLDSTLTSLAAYNTNGILTQTSSDTFTGRTITGTTDQITVTNGDGVSGNPTIAAVVASQAEAEVGTDNTKLMTPLRTEQHTLATNIGWGQTWQDVKASRTFGTSYQNTTGKPIQVAITGVNSDRNIQVSSDNSTWISVGSLFGGNVDPGGMSFIVPDNYYYRVDTTGSAGTIIYWVELR